MGGGEGTANKFVKRGGGLQRGKKNRYGWVTGRLEKNFVKQYSSTVTENMV